MASGQHGGYWLSVFAPRSQLVEFVLREPRFRQRMMHEIDPQFWVAPSLHYAKDYREPLQAGAIKQLGELKPWAPSRSYGLIVGLDADFAPIEVSTVARTENDTASRAVVEVGARLFVPARVATQF